MEIAIEGAHVLAQCASDLCRSTAAQYIKIRDGTTIPYIKGGHYRDLCIVLDSIEHTYIEAKIDAWVHVNTCDVDMRTAARCIKISDTTIILQPNSVTSAIFLIVGLKCRLVH